MALSPETDARIAAVTSEIRRRKAAGELDPDATLSVREMVGISHEIGLPVSESTFRNLQRQALARFAAGCLRQGISAADLRTFLRLIEP